MAGFRSALLRAVPVRGAACRLGRWQPIRGAATGDKAPASKKPSYSDAKYGREHAKSESSAAAQMHAMGAGRYAYLQDFYKSLQRGRVKLDFNEKPPTARELAEEQAREKAVQIMGRSMALGGLLVLACFGVAWQMIKWYLGVSSVREFNAAMQERLPKVSNEAKDSIVGRQLHDLSDHSRDKISESEALTAWRRQVRGQFNTPEGAAIARKNSILLAEKRKEERVQRKASKQTDGGSAVTSATAAASPPPVSSKEGAGTALTSGDAAATDADHPAAAAAAVPAAAIAAATTAATAAAVAAATAAAAGASPDDATPGVTVTLHGSDTSPTPDAHKDADSAGPRKGAAPAPPEKAPTSHAEGRVPAQAREQAPPAAAMRVPPPAGRAEKEGKEERHEAANA